MDINTFERDKTNQDLVMNDIARVKIRTTRRMMLDTYRENRYTGSIILIDENTNETVAAGMVI